jgi:hypothetical protein
MANTETGPKGEVAREETMSLILSDKIEGKTVNGANHQ